MFASLGKYVGGKVVTAILIVAVGLTCYYFYKNPEKLEDLWRTVRGALIWLGFAAVLPWALFFVPMQVIKTESNAAAIAMLLGYLVLDILMALWLADWAITGTLVWALVLLGFLLASVYNFLVCDFLAEHAEESL